jgi:hypothetical protein
MKSMAGIIGSMTAQARLRRGRNEVLSDKCIYELEPFAVHGFDPKIHNKHVWRRDTSGMEVRKKIRKEFFERQIVENEKVNIMNMR